MTALLLAKTLLMAQAAPALSIHIKVDGEGYLRFAKGSSLVYARQAQLTNLNGVLSGPEGVTLWPKISIPTGTKKLEIGLDGDVWGISASAKTSLGRIVLAMFNGSPLSQPAGSYVKIGIKPALMNPGDGLAGVIRVHSAVASTVKRAPQTAKQTFAPQSGQEAAQPTKIFVAAQSEVDEEYIYLGKIAKIEGDPEVVERLKDVNLGRTPVLGASRGLSILQVKAMVMNRGFKGADFSVDVPEGATVIRKGQVIEGSQVIQAAVTGAAERLRTEIPMQADRKVTPIKVPAGTVKLELDSADKSGNNVNCLVIVKVNDVKFSEVRLTLVPDPNAPMAKTGEQVRLRLVRNGATIEVSAKVKTAGYVGQRITVETESKTTHTGLLVSAGVVEVRL